MRACVRAHVQGRCCDRVEADCVALRQSVRVCVCVQGGWLRVLRVLLLLLFGWRTVVDAVAFIAFIASGGPGVCSNRSIINARCASLCTSLTVMNVDPEDLVCNRKSSSDRPQQECLGEAQWVVLVRLHLSQNRHQNTSVCEWVCILCKNGEKERISVSEYIQTGADEPEGR